jgi:hypothetical protein
MKIRKIQWAAALVACIGMLTPVSALAEAPVAGSPVVIDVALRDGGTFVGQVVDARGVSQPEQTVTLAYEGQEVVRMQTNEQGVFAAQGLQGGVYRVATAHGVVDARLWAEGTAPPTAKSAAMIVSGQDVISGQGPGCGILSWIQAHPFAATAIVATAVAVPVALASNDDDNS